MFSNWPDTLIDDRQFQNEQSRLSRQWTLLGLTSDAAGDGDWFRATLGTRSVFVQRFGSELKGFANRCAHRSFPLRTADKGNGPVVCGFHHWRYDRDGRAIGIPMCQELFGKTPREMDARLTPIDIATCGAFVFGRFAGGTAGASLEHFLADGFSILAAMSKSAAKPHQLVRNVKANWRLCFQISVEDYHLAAVHPGTFGKAGYLRRDSIGYFRFGAHSAYFTNPDPDALTKMAAACRNGAWRSADYRVFHIFPNLTVAHFRADGQNWFILVLQYVPVGADRSTMRVWFYPAPFAARPVWYNRWLSPLTRPVRALAVRHYVGKILSEDNEVCEKLQAVAGQIQNPPRLGALEERLAWFEEAYAWATSGPLSPPDADRS